MSEHGVLLLSCPDVPGIVHAVSGLLVEQRCTIVASQQFGSALSGGTFFLRVEFAAADGSDLDLDVVREGMGPLAERFAMTWKLVDPAERLRVVLMVSRHLHCLNDLLFRTSIDDLHLDVVAVVSNHPDAGRLADGYGIP